jgi:hypothetical protein
MANFKTHIQIGTVSSIITTVSIPFIYKLSEHNILNFNINFNWNILTLIIAFFLGIFSSLLPDIDLKHSKISQYFTKTLYIIFPVLFLHYTHNNQYFLSYFYKIENFQLLYFCVLMFLGLILAYTINTIFFFTMKHRGLVHSIPFALVLSILNFEFFKFINNYININPLDISLIFFIGYIVHLTLDEIYSVDLKNRRLKSSFGSALSLFKIRNIFGTIFLYLIIFLYFY